MKVTEAKGEGERERGRGGDQIRSDRTD